jgi:hypothetical protein
MPSFTEHKQLPQINYNLQISDDQPSDTSRDRLSFSATIREANASQSSLPPTTILQQRHSTPYLIFRCPHQTVVVSSWLQLGYRMLSFYTIVHTAMSS